MFSPATGLSSWPHCVILLEINRRKDNMRHPQTRWPSLLVVVVVLGFAAFPANGRELLLKVVDAKTGQPIAGMKGSYWLDKQTVGGSRLFTTNEGGEFVFPLEAATASISFSYHKEGYVEGLMRLGGEFASGPIGETFTLKLQPGLVIGGMVQDEKGVAVEGARVQLTFMVHEGDLPSQQGVRYGNTVTGADGRWTFGGAPASPTNIQVFTPHPDFVLKSAHHMFNGGQFDAMLQKTLVTQIQRGVTVTGTVLDEQGKPIAHSEVTPDSFGLISATQTDDKGHFKLRGVAPGKGYVAAKADGYAPRMIDLDLAAGMPAQEIRLGPGRTLRGRVVDSNGKAVAGARVRIGRWRNVSYVGALTADADGRFVWNSAPEDEVTLMVAQSGSFDRDAVSATAGEKEVILTVAPVITLRISVVDDQTNQPIEKFGVHVSGRMTPPLGRGGRVPGGMTGWASDRLGTGGKFEMTSPQKADLFEVRISAAGYFPADSQPQAPIDGLVELDFRLKKGGGLQGNLLMPDGKPAAGADVVLMEKGAATVENGILSDWAKTANVTIKTDASGKFILPPRTGAMKLVIIHESGWSIVKLAAGDPLDNLKLRAWCIVEGQLMKGSKPWPGQTMTLRPQTERGDKLTERQLFRYEATTDPQGRFTFKRVIDGTSDVAIRLTVSTFGGGTSYPESHGIPINLKPDEHLTGLQIGGTGRPVVAHVVTSEALKSKGLVPEDASIYLTRPPSFVPPVGWEDMTPEQKEALRSKHEQTPDWQHYKAAPKNFVALVRPDGTVRFDDIPSGQYTLSVSINRRDPKDPTFLRAAASASKKLIIEEMPGGRSDDPIDAGALVLDKTAEAHQFEPGQAAPAFGMTTFDAKPLKLADLHGKYVLIDFWATWCGPCIAEMKHIKRLQDTYAANPNLVILGVSVDDTQAEPTQFLQGRNLTWKQAWAGPSAWQAWGISGIPSVWLIGPDGKIIAREIAPEELDQTLAKAIPALK
jgi:thiol-disulfide isomerase/thioredoxin/protocatechuate 3,4-dioxygenase beta subunit